MISNPFHHDLLMNEILLRLFVARFPCFAVLLYCILSRSKTLKPPGKVLRGSLGFGRRRTLRTRKTVTVFEDRITTGQMSPWCLTFVGGAEQC